MLQNSFHMNAITSINGLGGYDTVEMLQRMSKLRPIAQA